VSQAIKKEDISAELWHRGALGYKVRDCQIDLYNMFAKIKKTRHKIGFFRTSRRFGKSFNFLNFAVERCLNEKNIIIPYAAPTIKHLKTVTTPIMEELTKDCPTELRPKFNRQDGVYYFPATRSSILLGAAENGHAEKFRGIRAKYGLIDEAGVIKDLKPLVNDILMPTLMYDDGFLVASGTPPPTPDHYYTDLVALCESHGTHIRKTIWENEALSNRDILEFSEALGCEIDWQGYNDSLSKADAEALILKATTSYRRELLAEIVIDEHRAIIPEMTDERESQIVTEWKRPEYYHTFVVGDLGFKDATAILFGYYDFLNAKIVIEDELIIHGPSSSEIAEEIKKKEKALWGDKPVFQRFADGDLIVLQDLSKNHGVWIGPVKKDVLEAQVNQLRLDLQNDMIRINPRCKTTVSHTKYGIWDKNRRAFDRSDDFYHFDALAALIYFVRHVNRTNNPWPRNHGASQHTHFIPEEKPPEADQWAKLIGG
jgi:hypothetical protein